VKGCEEYKKTFKTLDCNAYCTVEYGAPKPTDEVYMCSIVCIEVCMSSIVLMRIVFMYTLCMYYSVYVYIVFLCTYT